MSVAVPDIVVRPVQWESSPTLKKTRMRDLFTASQTSAADQPQCRW